VRKKSLVLLLVALAIALAGCDKKHFAPPPTPAGPTNLTAAAVSYKEINLSWQDNSDIEDGFKVWCDMGRKQYEIIATLSPNASQFEHHQLQPMTEYRYFIQAYRGEQHSHSREVSAVTPCPVELSYRAYFISHGLWAVEGTIDSRADEGCVVEITCCLYNGETGRCLGTGNHKVYVNAGELFKRFYFYVQQEDEPEDYPPCDYTVEITDVEIDY